MACRSSLASIVAVALSGLAAGCVYAPPPQAEAVAVVPRRRPPPRFEVPPPLAPERVELVYWQPGHWRWDGRDWDWIPGHYVERPHRQAVWEPGHWVERPNGWVWIEGHWR